MEVIRGYKVRLYPNKKQEQRLLQIIGACRWIWNYFLEQRKNYYLENKKTLPYKEMSRQLTIKRKEIDWLSKVGIHPLQQSLRRLDKSYNSFFKKTAKFPRFKTKKDNRQSFQKAIGWSIEGNKINIEKKLSIRFRGNFPPKREGTIVIKLENGKWYASTQAKVKIKKPKYYTKPIGIDVGITNLATTSDGEKFAGLVEPSFCKEHQSLSRKKIGSKKRAKTKKVLANKYEKVANRRSNHLHHISKAIVSKNHAAIVVEDLSVKKMMQNHYLAKGISNASMSELLRQLEYKQKAIGGKFIKIDRYFPSSKTCHKCGFILQDLSLYEREWKCPECGIKHDRDINAAKTILLQGLRNSPHVERSKTKQKQGILVEA